MMASQFYAGLVETSHTNILAITAGGRGQSSNCMLQIQVNHPFDWNLERSQNTAMENQSQRSQSMEIIGAIKNTKERVKDDHACQLRSESDSKSHGEHLSVMYDCGAAVSVAALSFAPHVNLMPISGDQKP
eukprot:26813-Amphidinium_carterae.1